jgi:2,3,4,5-tetrahydropyridine-2,6-dicarboxylate N-succinyltransferase
VTTEETIAALDRGELRVAEKVDGEWRVDEQAKAAILDYFRIRTLEPIEVGPYEYLDKIPLKHGFAELGVRVVPPATARYGSFLSRGVVMMPSYVNIGAWIGPNTMVDTWATVGSCAQIGADVHLAGGVGVGGVLEPVQARPVIVEDGAFIGSRCILTEGVLIGDGPRAGRAPGLRAALLRRRAGHAAEGVPGRHVPTRLRADHRQAQRADRPQDVPQRRAARVRDRRLTCRRKVVTFT